MKSYYLLYLPGIIILMLPLIKAIHDARVENARRRRQIAAKEAREAARREALRQAAEEREARKAAEEAAKAATPKRKPGRPRKNPQPEQRQEAISQAKPEPEPVAQSAPEPEEQVPITYRGNNAFAGQRVAFTGTLPGMTRSEAMQAVEKNGGKAYDTMPVSVTLLVVGNKPGARKLQKADDWQSCRKINAEEFFAMLNRPLTFEPDEFATYFHARLAKGAA